MSEAVQEEQRFWLKDNFAPVFEETTATDLTVTGEIPKALNGRLLRNGANPQSGESAHWFLGNGMLHGVERQNGNANWYRTGSLATFGCCCLASRGSHALFIWDRSLL